MDAESFHVLHRAIEPYMACGKLRPNGNSKKKHKNGAPNDIIPISIRLSAALCYFATATNPHSPEELLHGGEHFDDVTRTYRRREERASTSIAKALGDPLPRDKMHAVTVGKCLRRPPLSS